MSSGHDEDAGSRGFTGVGLNNRLRRPSRIHWSRANYSYGEVISATTNTSGFFMAEELVTAIYHRFVMFEPVFKEIGTGSATTIANYTYFTADFVPTTVTVRGWAVAGWWCGRPTARPASCRIFSATGKSPIPSIPPMRWAIRSACTPTPTPPSWCRTSPSAPATAPICRSSSCITRQTRTRRKAAAAIIPLTRLAAATVYDVAFSGSVDDRPVSMSWSFSTR